MKNVINYYYGLTISEFRKTDDNYNFDVAGIKYSFVLFEEDVSNLYNIFVLLRNNGIYCHEIIINNQNSIITFFENRAYILLKKNICPNNRVSMEDIIKYSVSIYAPYEFNWKVLWENKIDYYEYQISQLGIKYKLLKESLGYYIGLSENAINLLNFVNSKKIKGYVCHKRIKYKDSLDEFLNPVNVIIDNRMRDIAEYVKAQFFYTEFCETWVFEYLEQTNLSYDESLLFLSRLLYPSYYFDLYDEVIQGKLSEERINTCIKKSVQYEHFLKKIYIFLKKMYNIPEVEWLNI